MSLHANYNFVDFRQKNENNFTLESMDLASKEYIFEECVKNLSTFEQEHRKDCLGCLRILSRDAKFQSKLSDPSIMQILIHEAALDKPKDIQMKSNDYYCIIEALKCLSNLVYKNPSLICIGTEVLVDNLICRCETYLKHGQHVELLIFDFRLLFLLSAYDRKLSLDIQNRYFPSDVFGNLLKQSANSDFERIPRMSDLIIELLKLLFNLCTADIQQIEYESTYQSFIHSLRSLLVKTTSSSHKFWEIITHIVNLLTAMPQNCLSDLICNTELIDTSRNAKFKDISVRTLDVLVAFLDHQLTEVETVAAKSTTTAELLNPILNVIASASQSNRIIRKYFRCQILPNLGSDVKRLPEVGPTLRNRLCKHLTATELSDGVAESTALVIFILCKQNVDRAIKYSGFGNMAGFLTRNGLLRGKSKQADSAMSSSSSNSETDEYLKLRDQINPVTGRVESLRPNPMEGMSEEQKEYEAMKLVDKIDKLQRSGFIQPGTVGEDGSVHPVEHVLELLKDIKDDSSNMTEDD